MPQSLVPIAECSVGLGFSVARMFGHLFRRLADMSLRGSHWAILFAARRASFEFSCITVRLWQMCPLLAFRSYPSVCATIKRRFVWVPPCLWANFAAFGASRWGRPFGSQHQFLLEAVGPSDNRVRMGTLFSFTRCPVCGSRVSWVSLLAASPIPRSSKLQRRACVPLCRHFLGRVGVVRAGPDTGIGATPGNSRNHGLRPGENAAEPWEANNAKKQDRPMYACLLVGSISGKARG